MFPSQNELIVTQHLTWLAINSYLNDNTPENRGFKSRKITEPLINRTIKSKIDPSWHTSWQVHCEKSEYLRVKNFPLSTLFRSPTFQGISGSSWATILETLDCRGWKCFTFSSFDLLTPKTSSFQSRNRIASYLGLKSRKPHFPRSFRIQGLFLPCVSRASERL